MSDEEIISNKEGEFPLTDTTDAAILMHRDAHFGGQFDVMLDYYAKGGKGVVPDIEIERIQELAVIEKQMKENLAAMLLSGPDAERVGEAKAAYKTLRDLYETESPYNKIPLLIADLILSESEDPQEEIQAIAKEKGLAVSALIDLIRSENFYDPLFPGYGQAPGLAIKCLGLIGDKRAIVTLFEAIGSGDFFDEDINVDALHAIGAPARDFLLKVLGGKPFNVDNEKAAIALIPFKDEPEVSRVALLMLQDHEVRRHVPLATYLILICEGLKDQNERKAFLSLLDDPKTPKQLQQDIKATAKSWN